MAGFGKIAQVVKVRPAAPVSLGVESRTRDQWRKVCLMDPRQIDPRVYVPTPLLQDLS